MSRMYDLDRFLIQTPCDYEEANKRIDRAKLMSSLTIYDVNVFIEIERQMCLRGIKFSGDTEQCFYADNLSLQINGMVFK